MLYQLGPKVGEEGYNFFKNKSEKDIKSGKTPLRKARYYKIKKEIIENIKKKDRKELQEYNFEIENYIMQLLSESFIRGGPIKSKRIKNWGELLGHIKDEISARDYHEFLLLYQNHNYKSDYFSDYAKYKNDFLVLIKAGNNLKTASFIKRNTTNKEILDIYNDFGMR